MSGNQIRFQCTKCHTPLTKKLYCAKCKTKYPRMHGIPMLIPKDMPVDMLQTIEAWDMQWGALSGKKLDDKNKYYRKYLLQDTTEQLLASVDPKRHRRYLEIGCGPAFQGIDMAQRGFEAWGIDVSVEALNAAKRLYRKAGVKGYFIGGELHRTPLPDNCVDIIYGGGVIEHFRDTAGSIREMYRILKKDGIAFNWVPYLNLGTLTYRQIWGNIPDPPVLRQVYEFIHLTLLRGRHMQFGYEKSFTAGKLRRLYERAGFVDVKVSHFKIYTPFLYLPKMLRPLARKMTNCRLFWPAISVVGTKK